MGKVDAVYREDLGGHRLVDWKTGEGLAAPLDGVDAALVRIICSDPDRGKDILEKSGFTYGETDILAVELPKRTKQPLIAICAALLTAEINIHYAYPLLLRPHGPTLALYVDEPTLAAQIMIRKGFNLIGESDLKG